MAEPDGREVAVRFEIRAFGPMEIAHDHLSTQVSSRLQRVLLAVLVVRRGGVAALPTLVESMWPSEPSPSAIRNIRFHVHRLRQVLGDPDSIRYLAPGYALTVSEASIDIYLFERLISQGRAALARRDATGGVALLRQATNLCRGPAFQGLDDVAELRVEAQRLGELRLAAIEDRVATELVLDEHAAVISDLFALVATHPLRERFRAQLMTALYRSGRKADALAVYRDGRQTLVDELGIEPNEECRALERAILTDDSSLRDSRARYPRPSERPRSRSRRRK